MTASSAPRLPRREQGMAIVAALFLIVVVAALGVLAVRMGADQQQTANLELLGLRANAAAYSGLEFGSNQISSGAWLPVPPAVPVVPPTIDGFTVSISCDPPVQSVGGLVTFDLRATAVRGSYGQPDFVQRTLTRRVSNTGLGTW